MRAGILLPSLLGAATTVWVGYADGLVDGLALFMAATIAATSVNHCTSAGDIDKMDTSEGITNSWRRRGSALFGLQKLKTRFTDGSC